MKEFIFISDFDGTLTEKDFYRIIIDRYLKDVGRQLYQQWKQGELKDVEFLAQVFQSINRDEKEIYQDILSIQLDEYAADFVKRIKSYGGDFLVLSAGCGYYIHKLFDYHRFPDVSVIANPGEYRERGIAMLPDRESPFYSERYGVDKALVVKEYKTRYKKIYYAGDSGPDLAAAMQADIIFAKGALRQLLGEKNREFVPFDRFVEVETDLVNRGALI